MVAFNDNGSETGQVIITLSGFGKDSICNLILRSDNGVEANVAFTNPEDVISLACGLLKAAQKLMRRLQDEETS